MLVTVKLLKEIDACSDQIELFQGFYPQGINIPEDLTEAQKIYDEAGKAGLDIEWWLERMKLTAAVRQWYPDGKPERETHYQDGKLHDLKDGIAAVRRWHPNEKLQCELHYQNGVRV